MSRRGAGPGPRAPLVQGSSPVRLPGAGTVQSGGRRRTESARPVSPAGSQKSALYPVWAQPFALKEPAGWHPWRRLASWTWRGQAWLPQRMGPQLGEGPRPLPVWRSGPLSRSRSAWGRTPCVPCGFTLYIQTSTGPRGPQQSRPLPLRLRGTEEARPGSRWWSLPPVPCMALHRPSPLAPLTPSVR